MLIAKHQAAQPLVSYVWLLYLHAIDRRFSGAPHASFDLGTPFTNEVRRESIEVRILVMWKK